MLVVSIDIKVTSLKCLPNSFKKQKTKIVILFKDILSIISISLSYLKYSFISLSFKTFMHLTSLKSLSNTFDITIALLAIDKAYSFSMIISALVKTVSTPNKY